LLNLFVRLRFHKEELAGEEGNYIHNRAYVEDSNPMQVLTDIGHELLEVRASIFAVLTKYPRAAELWQTFERGTMWVLIENYEDQITDNINCSQRVAPGPGSLQAERSRFVKDLESLKT
jgi:hypothetical protein